MARKKSASRGKPKVKTNATGKYSMANKPHAKKELLALTGEDKRFLLRAVFWALLLRVIVFVLSYNYLAANGEAINPGTLMARSNYWDASHYTHIAEVGYQNFGDDKNLIVFYPLYPLLIFLLNIALGNAVLSALILSFVFQVAAGYFLQKLVALDWPELSGSALAFFSLFPTAYFLALPFTESLYCALAFAAFYLARKSRWAESGIASGFAVLSRVTGILLVPSLALLAWDGKVPKLVDRAKWPILFVAAGLCIYLGINWCVQGNPLSFSSIEREHWFVFPAFPWETISNAIHALAGKPIKIEAANESLMRLSCLAFGALVLAAGYWLLPKSYQLYGWLTLFMHASLNWQISFPRYLLPVFPFFIVLSDFRSKHRVAGDIALLASGALMIWLCNEFVMGRWAF